MSADRAALDHLLDGRAALVGEIQRLSAAVDDLDGVIARLRPQPAEPKVERAEVRRPVTPARSAPSKPRTRQAAPATEGKSIRVRILDMLATEDREFPLTEIIERIRAAGISAHDDAVRSIAVKLLRDGQVERVGRGQYRLARPESPTEPPTKAPAEPATATTDPSADSDNDAGPDASVEPERYTPPLNLNQPWASTTG